MTPALRKVLYLAVCALALTATACSSNNKGKIEGKWKFVSGPGIDQQAKTLESAKAYLFFDFRPDGTVAIGVESSDPAMQKLLVGGTEKTTMSCKYKLLSGDGVEFYDMPKEMQDGKGGGMFGKNKERARTSAKIDGDNMTLTDPDNTRLTCVRVK